MKHLKRLLLTVILIQSFISFGFATSEVDTLFISNNTDHHYWQEIKDYPFGDKRDNLLDVYWLGDSLIIDGFVGFSQTSDKKGIVYSIKNDTIFIRKFENHADIMYSNNFAVHINCGDIEAKNYSIAYSGFLLNNLNGYDATKELKQTEISGVNKGKFWYQHTWVNAIYSTPLQEPHLLKKNDSLYYIGQAPFYGSNVLDSIQGGFISKEVIFQYGLNNDTINFKTRKHFNSDFGDIDLTLFNFELNLGLVEHSSYYLNGYEFKVQDFSKPDTLFIPHNPSLPILEGIPIGERGDNYLEVYWFGDSLFIEGYVINKTDGENGIIYSVKDDTVFIEKYETGIAQTYSVGNYVKINLGVLPALDYEIICSHFKFNMYYGRLPMNYYKGKLWQVKFWVDYEVPDSLRASLDSLDVVPELFVENNKLYIRGYYSHLLKRETSLLYGVNNDTIFISSKQLCANYWGEEDIQCGKYQLELGDPKFAEYEFQGKKIIVQGLPESFCPISLFIQKNYYTDAQRLARLEIWNNPQPYNNQVAIPDTLINKYLKALQAVYGSGYSCVDSIFHSDYPIHLIGN